MNVWEIFKNDSAVVFDGAMGTYLYQKGVPKGFCYDEINITMPEVLKTIHREYIEAGAEIIETNTFGANRFVLEEFFGLGKKTRDINYFGARIAKEVAKGKAFVAGSIGPISRPHDVMKKLSEHEVEEIFKEQITALLEGGVDLLIFETYNCFDELGIGIRVAKEIAPDVPVIASMTFPNQLKTIFGEKVVDAGGKLNSSKADAIGTNCGSGPQDVFEATRIILSITDKPVIYMPNAGQARFIHGKFLYPSNPGYFARYAEKAVKIGAKFVGGCCGTTPQHIRETSEKVKGLKIKKRVKRIIIEEKEEKSLPSREIKTRVKELLEKNKLFSVEIEPSKGVMTEAIFKTIERWKGTEINTLNISDSPMARVRMNPFAFARAVKDKFPFETIVHMTCRDRNLLAIQADLLGASALGIENILALTGDPPSLGDYPFATGVYDLDSLGLIEIINLMNQGKGFLGNPLDSGTNFLVGASLNINRIDKGELQRATAKIQSGARFLTTQPVFDPDYLEEMMKELEKLRVPIIVTVMVLLSWKNAEYLHYEVPGISLPEWVLKRMEGKSGKEGVKEGVKIAKEIINRIKGKVGGILLVTPMEKYSLVEELI
ncbi:MAG: bifunctional homocysteine S-methyltransferase/methylenetetrahydrofolate reductase [Candidatus Aminicenantes bacterium]|nr:bifunctional homocysteine S-methyltransferase/methylenetetrahydrofolate reductase [Candidatus Aminicenantes bacterium]